MRWSVLCAGALSVAGCSLFADLDGLSSGAPADAGTSDTGVAPPGPAPTDASRDVTADAPPPGVDAGPPFCSTQSPAPFFCADFEDGRTLAQIFTQVFAREGASIALDATLGRSSAHSMTLTLPANTLGMEASARLALPRSLSKLTLEADVRIDAFGDDDEHDLIGVYRNSSREVSIEVTPARRLAFDEDIPAPDGGPDQIKTPLAFTMGSGWARIRWQIAVGGDGATSTVFVDGAPVGVVQSSSAPYNESEIVIGDRSVGSLSAPWRSRFDNIVVRIE